MSKQRPPSDDAWRQYTDWILSNGGFIHQSLSFSPTTPRSGSSVFTTTPISERTALITCPHSLVLDYERAAATLPQQFIEAVPPHAALRFLLCKEYLLAGESFWWPYLRVLPKEFNTPLYFGEEDKKFLDGCNLGYEARRSAWNREWSNGVSVLKGIGESVSGYTWELYLWAATVFSSRSFPGKLTSWDYNAEATRCYDDGTTAALFPMIDCLNHRPKARITWQPGPDAMSLVSVDRMEAGTEVFNNYGPKANGELLLGYGFAIPNNPSDTVSLRFNAPLTPAQERIRARQPQPLHPGIYPLAREAEPFYPKELTSLFHILTASPFEIPLLEKFPNADIVSIRNEVATQFQLFIAIGRKLDGFGTDPGEPQNESQFVAKILRDGQMDILKRAISYSENEMKKISAQHQGSNIFTIETAMTRKSPFASAVEKCFEATSAEELIEAEQDDIVFVLFLCWKLLCCSHEPQWRRWFEATTTHYPLPKEGGADDGDDGDDDDDDDGGIGDVFNAIFPDAAQLAPQVFGGDRWTPALMAWAMNIYQSEGVNAVVDGKMVYMISIEIHE